jgi:serine/threonine-protein kinase
LSFAFENGAQIRVFAEFGAEIESSRFLSFRAFAMSKKENQPDLNEAIPASSEPKDKRIERLATEKDLEAAFRRFTEFSKRFGQLEENMSLISGRLSTQNLEKRRGGLDSAAEMLERNRIRHSFLAELEDFKKDLPAFLDATQPEVLLRGATDRVEVLKEILAQLLRRQYKVGKQIGDGNTALVFVLEDIFTERKVAAKVLKVPTLTEAIKLEIKKVAGLKHRNIIKMIGESLDHFPFFVICEYVSGAMLTEIVQVAGSRPHFQAVKWLLELADALDYLRRKGIAHSNVRPSKIFVDEEQHLMISPFDIIKAGQNDRSLRKFREDCQYLSPEFLDSDNERISLEQIPYSDQFSLGLVAYKMLTGRDLFEGNSIREIILSREKFFDEQDKSNSEEKLSHITWPKLRQIVRQLLAKEPGDRYESLRAVMTELRELELKEEECHSLALESYRRCREQNQEFIRDFYNAFIDGLPKNYQAHFQNRQRQNTMLDSAIYLLFDCEGSENKRLLRSILAENKSNDSPNRHLQYGLKWYEQFLDTFVRQVHETDKRNWTSELDSAWKNLKTKALESVKEALASSKMPKE